jgi:hypothetical protein
MLAKHKVGSSTLLTRSMKKPLIFEGFFIFVREEAIVLAFVRLRVDLSFQSGGFSVHLVHFHVTFRAAVQTHLAVKTSSFSSWKAPAKIT